MSDFIVEVRDGGQYEFTPPPKIYLTLDQKRGPQGPGVNPADVGDISNLETEDKTDLVSAINELNMTGVSLAALYTNAKAG